MFEDACWWLPPLESAKATAAAVPPATLLVNLTAVLLLLWETLPRQNWTRILLLAAVGVILTLIPVTSPNDPLLFWPDIDTVAPFSLVTSCKI